MIHWHDFYASELGAPKRELREIGREGVADGRSHWQSFANVEASSGFRTLGDDTVKAFIGRKTLRVVR